MSSIGVKTFDVSLRRDSFSDRVCDDLSQIILQFLDFEDKFRLECVSKQFQRTVFQRTYVLQVDSFIKVNKDNSKLIDIILKKVPNIRSVRQKRFDPMSGLNDIFIDLMVKNFNNLVEIECDSSHMSDTTEELLVKKFGSKIRSIYLKNSDFKRLESLSKCCPNVRQLSYLWFECKHCPLLREFYSSFIPFLENISHMKNMSKISLQLFRNDFEPQIRHLKTFVANNGFVTHLAILFDINFDTEFTAIVFKQISRLNNLIELEVYELSEELVKIIVNCLKLKSLSVRVIKGEETDIESVFTQLKHFQCLQRLSINCIEYHSGMESTLNLCLRELKGLTDLKIGFPTYPSVVLSECLVTDLDKHLPRLRSLYIKNVINASEGTADILCRLSCLESLDLLANNELIKDLIECKVRANCPRIKFINDYQV